jgi:hypothetical protein
MLARMPVNTDALNLNTNTNTFFEQKVRKVAKNTDEKGDASGSC